MAVLFESDLTPRLAVPAGSVESQAAWLPEKGNQRGLDRFDMLRLAGRPDDAGRYFIFDLKRLSDSLGLQLEHTLMGYMEAQRRLA